MSLVVALGGTTVIGLAAWLEPDARGHGTHEQLGLSPCIFHTLTGLPCPMCGATTAFSHLAHGHVVEAVLAQPFAAVLFLVTVALTMLAWAEVLRPAHRWARLADRLERVDGLVAAGGLLGLFGAWAYKLWLATTGAG